MKFLSTVRSLWIATSVYVSQAQQTSSSSIVHFVCFVYLEFLDPRGGVVDWGLALIVLYLAILIGVIVILYLVGFWLP